jgi:hypothetical protein
MPRYKSLYDPNPLPDPGDGSRGASEPTEAAPSKSLAVNWASPQPLHTVTPPPLGGGGNGKGGSNGGPDNGDGDKSGGDQPNQLIPHIPTPGQLEQMKLYTHGPEWESVHVRPEDLLAYEQRVLDSAKALAQRFNALVADSEAKLSADFWGMGEGRTVTAGHSTGKSVDSFEPHVEYTESAVATREFVRSLRMSQRAALQHAADTITLSGSFIELLNNTADAYGETDQYSVFPDKSSISKGQSS